MRSLGSLVKRVPKPALLAATLLAAACASMKNFDRNAPFDATGGDSIVVMGVEPRYRIAVSRGSVRKDIFYPDSEDAAVINARPEDGYLVFRVHPKETGERYGVVQVFTGEGISGPTFRPCGGVDTVTFEVKRGQVVYVGDVLYSGAYDGLRPRYSFDAAAAQSFIERNYPRLKGPLATASFELMQVATIRCFPGLVPGGARP